MSEKRKSRRQRLAEFVERGRLRDALSYSHLNDEEVEDLIVALCLRYCEPRKRKQP